MSIQKKMTIIKMLRLNIPLSTNQSTRPNFIKGRVLWILIGWLMLILGSFIIAELWFTRDTLSAYAPDNTIAVVHLIPSRQVWTKLISDFGNLPLISNRSLTIIDFAGLKPKEISIFVFDNNNSAVAIRTNEKNLNKEVFDAYGINIQKLTRNRWLFSSKPLPYAAKGKTNWSLGSIWPGTIGNLQLDNFFGHIIANKNGYSVDIPKTKKTGDYLPAFPESTIAAVSLQPKAEIDLSNLFNQFDTLLNPLGTIESEQIGQKLNENGGKIILSNNGFLLETVFDSSFLSQILKTAAVFRNLTLEPMPMPDGSLVQEMKINQSEVNFDSILIKGHEVKSVKTENGQFLALDGEKTDIIASNQTLLEEYLGQKINKTNNKCGSQNRFVFLKPKDIENALFNDKKFVSNPILLKSAVKFTEISINKNKMYLCY